MTANHNHHCNDSGDCFKKVSVIMACAPESVGLLSRDHVVPVEDADLENDSVRTRAHVQQRQKRQQLNPNILQSLCPVNVVFITSIIESHVQSLESRIQQ